MRLTGKRAGLLAMAAVVALGTLGAPPARATPVGPASLAIKAGTALGTSDLIKVRRRHHRYRRGNRAALGAVLGVFGTIAGLAAAEHRRHVWERRHRYYYYGSPYGYGAPYYYGRPRYYYPPRYHYGPAPGYYRYRRW